MGGRKGKGGERIEEGTARKRRGRKSVPLPTFE